MIKTEKGAFLANGIDTRRPVHRDSVNRLLKTVEPIKAYLPKVEWRSPECPRRSPSINYLPRAWFMNCQLVEGLSLQDVEDHVKRDFSSLASPLLTSLRLDVHTSTQRNHFLVAKPSKEGIQLLNAERMSIKKCLTRAMIKSGTNSFYRRPLDITLAYFPPDPQDQYISDIKEFMQQLPLQQDIELSPLTIDPSLPKAL